MMWADNKLQRCAEPVLLALGQKRCLKNKPVAIMHFIIYAGFIIINHWSTFEILLDGISQLFILKRH
jgi:hypothetical protein